MAKNISCACVHCGQALLPDKDFASQEEADNYAIHNCGCYAAKLQVKKKNALAEAQQRITTLFGGSDGTANAHARNLLLTISEQILNGEIGSATVQISGNTRAKIAPGSKAVLKITRTDTHAATQEIF